MDILSVLLFPETVERKGVWSSPQSKKIILGNWRRGDYKKLGLPHHDAAPFVWPQEGGP